MGSRNAGATNVTLNVGWLPGFLTLAGDMGKGYLAAAVGSLSSSPLVKYLTPAFAIAGHNWPVWLRFHGGGGLATFVGGCLALSGWPLPAFGLGLWGLTYLLLKDHDRSAVWLVLCCRLPAYWREPPRRLPSSPRQVLPSCCAACNLSRKGSSVGPGNRRRAQALEWAESGGRNRAAEPSS